jgi:hypothetical protein
LCCCCCYSEELLLLLLLLLLLGPLLLVLVFNHAQVLHQARLDVYFARAPCTKRTACVAAGSSSSSSGGGCSSSNSACVAFPALGAATSADDELRTVTPSLACSVPLYGLSLLLLLLLLLLIQE